MFVWKLAVYHLGDDPFILLLCSVKYKINSDDRMTKYHFFSPAEIFNLSEIMIQIYFTFEINIKKSQISVARH